MSGKQLNNRIAVMAHANIQTQSARAQAPTGNRFASNYQSNMM